MKRFRSMRWRLQFWHGLLLALVLIVAGVTAFEYARSAVISSTDAELERRAGFFDQMMRGRPPPPPIAPGAPLPANPPPLRGGPQFRVSLERVLGSLPPGEQAAYAPESSSGWYYVIWLHTEAAPIRSANAPADVPKPQRFAPRDHGLHHRARGDLRETFIFLPQGGIALVGHDMTSEYRSLRRFAWFLAAGGAGILALGLLVGRWLVIRALRPIQDISNAAVKIAEGDLKERIRTRDTDSELGQLTEVLNTTFARLESSFAQQARFTADAAHELRTPVSIVLTHTQSALQTPGGLEEHRESFAACQRAAQRMRALIESLLQLARLDSGERSMKPAHLDLAERTADCVDLLRPIADARGITLHLDLRATPIQGDAGEIDQIVTNLVANAIHHNVDQGEVRVATRVEPDAAVLEVSDKGPGIAAQHLPHLFDRFYRADASRSRASGGAGLGLAIVKAAVVAHHGTLSVQSELGHGSAFTVRFPLKPGQIR